MKKTFTASFKDSDGNLRVENFEGYETKKKLIKDMRANGYRVRVVVTPDKFDEEVEKYGRRCDEHNQLRKYIRKSFVESGYVWNGRKGEKIDSHKRSQKYQVYGEYGGTSTNLRDAKNCAKEASTLNEDKQSGVWLIEDGCQYIEYGDGKLIRDGWTIKK